MSHSKSDANRVFITGLSALTSTGQNLDETWRALIAGNHGLDEIKQWDASSWTCRLGGELKNFKPASLLPDRKLIKAISRQDIMGINAAIQAVEHSQLLSYRDTLDSVELFNDNTGVYVGSPGNKFYQQYDFLPLLAKTNGHMQDFAQQLFNEVHPMWLLRILPNNVLAYTGITYNFKGVNHNITNHAVGGVQAIIEAYHAIKNGQAQRAVVVAYDAATEAQALFYYDRLGVISSQHLKPFDRAHDGTILADGAAAMVLESEESVNARAAVCYGEITGGMATTEAQGLFSIEAEGEYLAALISRTLKQQSLQPDDVGLVVAHGNGNKKSDVSEAHAIEATFGDYKVPVTAFKWSVGHTICASGLIDAVLTTYALRSNAIPGIANLDNLAPACEALHVSRENRVIDKTKPYALLLNRGFASMNACLVIKACE